MRIKKVTEKDNAAVMWLFKVKEESPESKIFPRSFIISFSKKW